MFYFLFVIIFMGSFFLPWWWFVGFLFVMGLSFNYSLSKVAKYSFFAPFLSWGVMTFYVDHLGNYKASLFLVDLLSVSNKAPIYLLPSLLAGTLGFMFGISGYFWRKNRSKPNSLFV